MATGPLLWLMLIFFVTSSVSVITGSTSLITVPVISDVLTVMTLTEHIANHRAGDVPVRHRATHRYSHQYVCPDLSEHRREPAISQGKDNRCRSPAADPAGSADLGRLAAGCVVAPAGSTSFRVADCVRGNDCGSDFLRRIP